VTVVCADFGSTFTKVTVVDPDAGVLLATSSARTTIATDVMDGFDAAIAAVAELAPSAASGRLLACSSAGGGLRLAVVGYERAITAEAGYRVGLSAGARVVHVASGLLDAKALADLRDDRPDVVLLAGGTDGGNSEVLLANARAIAREGVSVPVVVAGNADAREQVLRILRRGGVSTYACRNVLPKIGVLDPRPARETIREVFIDHVIGGKHLSERVDLSTMVQAATPDAVLAGVELLADGVGELDGVGDVVVVDVGGATTDVYSVVTPDAEQSGHDREAVSTLWRSRTVEGDLGVRWNAVGVVEAAMSERLIDQEAAELLRPDAEKRVADPGFVPSDEAAAEVDRRLATLAATVALRRHARPQESGDVRYPGKDLRRVRLVVGSGGVLRHSPLTAARHIVKWAVGDAAGGWRTPDRAKVTIDARYVLAAAGLLARENPRGAMQLLLRELVADAAL
jgi:uncharacterized protein (TIGR01319 family)